MNEQKERLERELRFLKDSLAAGVVSKEEYEKGKARIERKLSEIDEELPTEDIEIKEIKNERPHLTEKSTEEEKEKPKAVMHESKDIWEEKEEEKPAKKNKKTIYYIAVIVLLVLIYFFMNQTPADFTNLTVEDQFVPECIKDSDCEEIGKIGICENPDTKEANCTFKDPVETKLTILNDESCSSCDTSRMKSILNHLFKGTIIEEVDYNTVEGQKLVQDFDIDVLPAYIYDSNLGETYNFDNAKRTFVEENDVYLMLPTASGSNYFFNRPEIKQSLKLFVLPNVSDANKNNVQDVLDLFEDTIKFEKIEVTDEEKLKEDLAITTYPTFLVNNQLKFQGVQSPEVIKQKFCELNDLTDCVVELSKDLK